MKIAIAFAFVSLAIGCAATGHATLIDRNEFSPEATELGFDELSNGTIIGDHYLPQGVLFDNAMVFGTGHPVSSPNVIASSDGEPLRFSFPGGATQVGIHIDADGVDSPRTPQMHVYDMLGNFLDSADFGRSGPAFLGFEFSVPIGSVVLGSVIRTGFQYTDGHDDLIFTLVPEPSSAALAAWLCLGSLACRRKLCERRSSRHWGVRPAVIVLCWVGRPAHNMGSSRIPWADINGRPTR